MIDNFEREVLCIYRSETYRVRDNGAIYRLSREDKRRRPIDEKWTFGNVNKQKGYMFISSESVHRIVATAYHGPQPSENHIVDHIDTNRQNNRPENLRWITRLENIIYNPITLSRILYKYGSLDNFFADPSKPIDGELDSDFQWMRTVTKEEAENTKENLIRLGKTGKISRGGSLGEWIFQKLGQEYNEEENKLTPSLTKNAVQNNWKTPAEFPHCPGKVSQRSLIEYSKALKQGQVFAQNKHSRSICYNAELSEDSKAIVVICQHQDVVKEWSVTKVLIQKQHFVHESLGMFFKLDGAQKEYTLALGRTWEGGDTFDDLVG